jgi:hypothetical protein
MNSAVTMLLQGLEFSRRLMLDAVRDVFAAKPARQPISVRCRCARVLGMAVVADRELLRHLGPNDLPDLPVGFEARFARWGTGADTEIWEYDSALPEIFASHRDALLRATGALGPADLDQPVNPPDHLGEDGLFDFGTIGEMILAASAYTSFLAGEASAGRNAHGNAAVDDAFDRAIAAIKKPVRVPGGGKDRRAGYDFPTA